MIFSSKIVSHITDTLTHRVTSIDATVYKGADVKKAGVINGSMRFPSTSMADPTNKILTSIDVSGKIALRDLREVYPTYPIGSIISIREDEFNSTNFYLNEIITQDLTVSPLPVLDNRFGRGKANGQFAGWYLCNGLYWEDPNVIAPPIQTPNLNGFRYFIQSNGGNQPTVQYFAFTLLPNIIIGGPQINFYAQETTAGKYNNSTNYIPSNNLADGDIIDVDISPTSTQFQVSRQIHIVYLGSNNLVWRDDTP